MKNTYFDRIVLREAYNAGDLLEALAVFEKHNYEEVHHSAGNCYYYVVFEYKGKRKANIKYIELMLEYSEQLRGYIKSGNREEYLDWISFAAEGIWTAFSDVAKKRGVFHYYKDQTAPYSMRHYKNLMKL